MAKMVRLADGSYLDAFAIRRLRVESDMRTGPARDHYRIRVILTLTDGSDMKFETSTADEAQAEVDRIIGEIESVGGPAAYLRASRPPVGWISPDQFATDQNPFLSTLRAYQGVYLAAGEQRGDPIMKWIAGRFGAMAAEVEMTGATSPEDYEDRRQAMLEQAEIDARNRLRDVGSSLWDSDD